MKYPVHVIHEYCGCIGYSERHHQVLIVTITGPEGSLLYIFFLDPDLMVTRSQIYLGEYRSSLQLVHQIINSWKRVSVLNGHLIQLPIIHTQPGSAILFLDQQYRCTPRRYTWSNKSLLRQVLQLTLQLDQFRWCHSVGCHRHWSGGWDEINCKLDRPDWWQSRHILWNTSSNSCTTIIPRTPSSCAFVTVAVRRELIAHFFSEGFEKYEFRNSASPSLGKITSLLAQSSRTWG